MGLSFQPNLFTIAVGRLYCKAKVLGFKRGQRMQKTHTSLVKIEGVKTKDHTDSTWESALHTFTKLPTLTVVKNVSSGVVLPVLTETAELFVLNSPPTCHLPVSVLLLE